MPRPLSWPISWLCGIALVGVIVAGCDKVGGKSASQTAASVASRINAIKQAGEPVTPKELNEWPAVVVPNENGALALTNAFASLIKPSNRAAARPPRTGRMPADMKLAMTFRLSQNKMAREKIQKAAAFKKYRYPVDWSAGFNTKLPHLEQIRNAFQLFSIEAAAFLDNDREVAALGSVHTIIGLARSLDNEPSAICQQVRNAALQVASHAVERIVSQKILTDPQLTALQNAFQEAEAIDTASPMWIGERCLVIQTFELPPDEIARRMATMLGEAPIGGDAVRLQKDTREKQRS